MSIIYSVGVDPGLSGRWALLKNDSGSFSVIETAPMPVTKERELDTVKIISILKQWWITYGSFNITFEKQCVMSGQGISSGFTTGKNFGILIGIAAALDIPFKIVTPKEWQKPFPKIVIPEEIEKLNIKDAKKRSLALCQHLFPNAQIRTKRGRYQDEISDSILIGYWTLKF